MIWLMGLQTKDGVMFEVVRLLSWGLKDGTRKAREDAEDGSDESKELWTCMGSLSFDSMSIKNKVKSDPNTHELVGFSEGALKEEVLLRELDALDSSSSNTKDLRLALSQQFMVFICTSWDVDNVELKSVVAGYSTGSGIKLEFLVPCVR